MKRLFARPRSTKKQKSSQKKRGRLASVKKSFLTGMLSNWRRQLVLILLFFTAGGLLFGAFYRQVIQANYLIAEGNKRYTKYEAIASPRGTIYDRNGNSLAASVAIKSLAINPKQLIHNPYKIALLAHILEKEADDFYQELKQWQNTHFKWLRRRVSPEFAYLVEQIEGGGIQLIREYKRFYPDAEITAHLLGFTNIDDEGIDGVELSFEEWLKGKEGRAKLTRDGRGRLLKREIITEGNPGKDLRLTIDRQIQIVAYRALKAAVIKHKAKGGSIIVADSHTGEILAMVNQPAGNPNRTQDRATPGLMKNRTITDVFEPGSTMKPFVVATALETGKWHPETVIPIGSFFRVGRRVVRDVGAYQKELTVRKVLMRSSNIGVSKIALSMEPLLLWEKYKLLGLGEKSDLRLVGENSGFITPFSAWERDEFEYITKSFGYGLNITMLKLAQIYTVFANGGIYKPLKIVQSRYEAPTHRVFSQDSALTVLSLLEDVTNKEKGGSGWRARVEKFRVAGKSGTVRKIINGQYSEDLHNSFFVGLAPVSNPQYVVAVMIDEPREGGYYGGAVAAPVFSEVMGNTLRIMGTLPDGLIRLPKLELLSR